jgi:ATP-dependent DNA ligase
VARQHGPEGIVSKRLERAYLPGDRSVGKTKCLNRAEFVIVGWSDTEGSRPLIGALLLSYYEPDERLLYAGRVGRGMPVKTLRMLHERLRPRAIAKKTVAETPPANSDSAALSRCPRSVVCAHRRRRRQEFPEKRRP